MTFAQPFSDYEILDRVGAGAMGTVFKARHKKLNRIVALKVLKPSLARDARYVDRLRREARIVASLNHPHIVTGYDLGEEGGYHFFVMEFVEGKSLRELLVEWGMVAEEYVRRVARQVALALDHAWQRGVIHRDIKPGNILIDEAGNVKLTDMGLAKGPADLTITRDGATVGTPQYISPEQARNPHDVDVRSDLWSLGATLYHMAAGVPPFRGDTMAELITNVLQQAPTPPNEVNPALSEGMALVIRKLLVKNLTGRYQTPRELLDDLDRIDRSQPPAVDAAALSGTDDGARWWPRALAVLGLALLLGGAWWVGVQMREAPPHATDAAEYLRRLDVELRAATSPGARLALLDRSGVRPSGSDQEVALRRRAVVEELQHTVDGAVAEVLGKDLPRLQGWLRQPDVWPDRAQFEREHVQARLLAASGVSLQSLTESVPLRRLEELRAAIDRALALRDEELVQRFDDFLRGPLHNLFERRVRGVDFAGAQAALHDGLRTFGDGVQAPRPERLPTALQRRLQEALQEGTRASWDTLEAAEARCATLMRDEVEEVLQGFLEQVAAGTPVEVLLLRLQRFRRDFGEVWPASARFRVGRDPWPDLTRRFEGMQQRFDLLVAAQDIERFKRRCDAAWRTLLHGSGSDALAVLGAEPAAGAAYAVTAARHREAMTAWAALEAGVLRAVRRASKPPIAFPRSGGTDPVELFVVGDGDAKRLEGRVPGQAPRPVQLAELGARELLAGLAEEPFAAMDARQRRLAEVLVRLIGDQLVGLAGYVATLQADDQFLVDEVWPRIVRLRGERVEVTVDRGTWFQRLAGLRDSVLRAKDREALLTALDQLENGMRACRKVAPEGERSDKEVRELGEAAALLRLGRRRRDWTGEIDAQAPRGAEVDVRIEGEELLARVALGPASLDGQEGWTRHVDRIEFGGGLRPWNERSHQVLRGETGLGGDVLRARLVLDLAVPPAAVGQRSCLVRFRGIAVALVFAGDDSVHASLIDGDPAREATVQQAIARALAEVPGKNRVVAVPGATHRLTIDVNCTSARRAARVSVAFEGKELEVGSRDLGASDRPVFELVPLQEIAVARALVEVWGS